jgi:UDP-glucose 4-epimerase
LNKILAGSSILSFFVIYNVLNRPINVQYLEKRKKNVVITHSKINKARDILVFDPKVNIDDGLKNL